MSEHILDASGCWTNDGSSWAIVECQHPDCATWTREHGRNDHAWPGFDWKGSMPLAEIVAQAQASHDAWFKILDVEMLDNEPTS